MPNSEIVYQTEQLLENQLFDFLFSSESDKMTALWPDVSLTFPFYVTFSKSIPNWTTFVREILRFDD